MFTSNPFAELPATMPTAVMQAYVVIMIILVAAGTLFDIVHKGSARYFFDNWRAAKSKALQQVGGGELVSIALKTGVVDVLASGEFCNARRRVAHLLTMHGFLIYVVTTIIMVFGYPTPATPAPGIVPLLWWIGGLMVCIGGYWFWFFIRADVAAEGGSPFRIMRADLFICECYMYEKIVRAHLSLSTLREKLPAIGARRVILTHMGDDMLSRASEIEIETAADGKVVTV